MIEIDIPTIDPIQHEPKIFLGMTARQCICIVPGVLLGIASFSLTYKVLPDLAVIACGLCVIPAVCMGWVSPYNMKFEQFVRLWWFNNFISNPKRIYKTDEAEEIKRPTMKELQDLEQKQKVQALESKKKNKEKKNQQSVKEGL